jgi:hypothetical protein
MTVMLRASHVIVAGVGLVLAACGPDGPPPPGPVGLSAEAAPPAQASPEGVLGGAEVGAGSLADPGIATLGQPLP